MDWVRAAFEVELFNGPWDLLCKVGVMSRWVNGWVYRIALRKKMPHFSFLTRLLFNFNTVTLKLYINIVGWWCITCWVKKKIGSSRYKIRDHSLFVWIISTSAREDYENDVFFFFGFKTLFEIFPWFYFDKKRIEV